MSAPSTRTRSSRSPRPAGAARSASSVSGARPRAGSSTVLCGRALAPRHATLRAVSIASGDADRPRPRDLLPGAAFVHRRGRARAAGARRPGRAAAAARALPRGRGRTEARRSAPARPAPRAAGRVHRARVPQRQARPRAGRGRRRPDRGEHRSRRALGGPLARGRVLARDQRAAPSACRAAHAGRGDARLSRGGDRLPRARRRAWPARDAIGADRGRCWLRARQGALLRDGITRRARRPAERRQELAAERACRRRAGDRHADPGHHARQGRRDDPDRRRAGARDRHRRPARGGRRSRAHRRRAQLGRDRALPTRCCSCTT